MKRMPSGISFTSREALNMPAGHSNMAPALRRTTRQASAWTRISPGEYVSIQDHGGELHTFVVMFVEAIEK